MSVASRRPLIVRVVLGLALVLLVAAEAPQALRTASAPIFLIREGEVVEEGLYVAGSVVRIAGTIEGDLIVLATEHLEVTGTIVGDVIGFATTAEVGGVVEGSVRLAGIDLQISADVGGDVVGLGRDVRTGGSMAGDLLVWAGSLHAGGEVGHDMGGRTFGTTVIAGSVGRDVEMTVGALRVLETARVAEDLGYRSAREGSIHPDAVIGGVAVHRLPLTPALRLRAATLMFGFIAFVLLLAQGLLRISVRRQHVAGSVMYLVTCPVGALLRGLVQVGGMALCVAIPWAGATWASPKVALGFGLAGLALIPILVVWFLALVSSAPVPFLTALGRLLTRGRLSPYSEFLLPAVPLALLLVFPYVGWIVGLVVLTLGAGARAGAKARRRRSRLAV